jgi:hypothetical protein
MTRMPRLLRAGAGGPWNALQRSGGKRNPRLLIVSAVIRRVFRGFSVCDVDNGLQNHVTADT